MGVYFAGDVGLKEGGIAVEREKNCCEDEPEGEDCSFARSMMIWTGAWLAGSQVAVMVRKQCEWERMLIASRFFDVNAE